MSNMQKRYNKCNRKSRLIILPEPFKRLILLFHLIIYINLYTYIYI